MVLIDRRFRRDLPIEANYVGKAVDTLLSERVSVEWKEHEGEDKIVLYTKKAMNSLSVEHLIGIRDLNKEDLDLIFKTADSFKQVINRPIKKVPSLRDITIANLSSKIQQEQNCPLSLLKKDYPPTSLTLALRKFREKRRNLVDTVNNILSMKVDLVVMRHPSPGAASFLSKNVNAKALMREMAHMNIQRKHYLTLILFEKIWRY